MAKYKHFEELPVWQDAARLYNRVMDLLEQPNLPFTPGFKNQLDRAALSISNNVAEAFQRAATKEVVSVLGIARGSAGEVSSMVSVVKERPKLKRLGRELQEIQRLADSCGKQVAAWIGSIESASGQGKRNFAAEQQERREAAQKAIEFRLQFLRNLKPEHPLYRSSEARAARGENDLNS